MKTAHLFGNCPISDKVMSWQEFMRRTVGLLLITLITGVVSSQEDAKTTATVTPDLEAQGEIAFVSNRDGNNEIYLMDVHGNNMRNLTESETDEWRPAWSPDGDHLAFVSDRDGNLEIYTFDSNKGEVRNLTNNDANDDAPAWSPNGTRLAFMSNRDGGYEIYT